MLRNLPGMQLCSSNYTKVLLEWVDPENLPEYLGGTSKATLLDDAGPWQDPKIMAEVSSSFHMEELLKVALRTVLKCFPLVGLVRKCMLPPFQTFDTSHTAMIWDCRKVLNACQSLKASQACVRLISFLHAGGGYAETPAKGHLGGRGGRQVHQVRYFKAPSSLHATQSEGNLHRSKFSVAGSLPSPVLQLFPIRHLKDS